MIRSLHVKNFLSLKDFQLDFTQRNVLVGPNMSGKTNIINALRFLTLFLSNNLSQGLNEFGGIADFYWKGVHNRDRAVSFKIDCNIADPANPANPGQFTYLIELQGSNEGVVTVERENLVLHQEGKNVSLIDIHRGKGKVLHIDGREAFQPPGLSSSALEFAVPGWYGSVIKYSITRWCFYNLSPLSMKRINPIKIESFLALDGSNISSWLLNLQTKYPKEFRAFKQAITDALPEVEEILTFPTQASMAFLATKERSLGSAVPMWRMSDGELVFLAYVSLMFAPLELGAPVYCIEEPENYMNPRLLELLVEIHNQRRRELQGQAAQIVITTHSPSLVNKLDLEELVITRKKDGITSCIRGTAVGGKFKELLREKEIGLGELWQSGALNAD